MVLPVPPSPALLLAPHPLAKVAIALWPVLLPLWLLLPPVMSLLLAYSRDSIRLCDLQQVTAKAAFIHIQL